MSETFAESVARSEFKEDLVGKINNIGGGRSPYKLTVPSVKTGNRLAGLLAAAAALGKKTISTISFALSALFAIFISFYYYYHLQ